MPRAENNAPVRRAGSRGVAVAGYSASAVLITGLVTTLTTRVSGAVIGLILGGYLLAVGLLFLRHITRVTARQQRETTREMSTNISELKELQQEIDQGKQHFKQLFDIVPCYISVQDRDYPHRCETNALFAGLRRAGGGALLRGLQGPRRDLPRLPGGEDLRRRRGPLQRGDRDHPRRPQAEMIVHSMPMRDERGEITSVMEVSTNITEVKRLQRQLAMMGLAVAGMAHRVKNILMGLEGGIFVVNTGFEEDDSETVDEGWGMVERNVTNISRIGQGPALLLQGARAGVPGRRLAGRDGGGGPRALPRARVEGGDRSWSWRSTRGCRSGRFDPEGIHNLLTNLLPTPSTPAASIRPRDKQHDHPALRLKAAGDAVLIEVADNGVGIPEKMTTRCSRASSPPRAPRARASACWWCRRWRGSTAAR